MPDRRSANRTMFWRVLRRSVFANRGRLFVILLALGAGAAITAALLNLQVDAKRRITTEFRSFGPNVLITPRSSGDSTVLNTMTESAFSELQSGAENANYIGTPFLYVIAKVSSEDGAHATEAVIAGTHLDLLENREPGWKLQPEHPSHYSQDECLAGATVAHRLHLHIGATVRFVLGRRTETCRLASILASGGSEDEQIFAALPVAQRLAD